MVEAISLPARAARVFVAHHDHDSRIMIAAAMAEDSGVEVVGASSNGRLALEKLERLAPDVVLLDVEMPVMDGFLTLREVQRLGLPVATIMLSARVTALAPTVIDCLWAGAGAWLPTPWAGASPAEAVRAVAEQYPAVIDAALGHGRCAAPGPADRIPGTQSVAVGWADGGVRRLRELVAAVPGDRAWPTVVHQPLPLLFAELLAERLERATARPVRVLPADGELQPGVVYLAGPTVAGAADAMVRTPAA